MKSGSKFLEAVNAMSVDIAKVSPKNICGAIKNLFVSGYVIINIIAIPAIRTVFIFKKSSKLILIIDNIANIIRTSFLLTKFEAYGLFFVLSTCLSKFLSKKSFITQPIVLVVIIPTIIQQKNDNKKI